MSDTVDSAGSEPEARTAVIDPTGEEHDGAEGSAPLGFGASLGRYLVLETVGHGAMGRVLRAYDPKLQREVALKLVSNATLDAGARDRMLREARAMARLSHPNVVAVYDAEESSAGIMLVMEYVAGQTLRRWSTVEHPWPEIVARYLEAGRGLAAAHEAGLLHRDFKPANALVAESGAVKVTDFGLAKHATGPDSTHDDAETYEGPTADSLDGSLTHTGVVLGTPRYMAPEQHCGEPLDARVDQYSFCVALWEALAGAPPFRGRALEALLVLKLQGAPPWPASAPGVPRSLVAALRRGLAPDPAHRWPSMQALLAALDDDPGRRRLRWGVAAAGAGLAGLLIVGWQVDAARRCTGAAEHLAGVWDEDRRAEVEAAVLGIEAPYVAKGWERAATELDRYASEWAAMHTQACEATAVRGEQSTDAMDLRMGCLHRARQELEAVTNVLAEADAKMAPKIDGMLGSLPPLARCADVEALRAEVEPPPPEQREAVEQIQGLLAEARALRKGGRYSRAEEVVTRAQAHLTGVDYGPVATEVTLEHGLVLDRLGRYEEAEATLREALASASAWQQWRPMQHAAESLLYVVGYRQRQPKEGLRYWELVEGLARGDRAREASARNILATVLEIDGKYEQAEAEHRRALALREELVGPDHPDVALSRNNLANVLDFLGKYEESEAEHREALAMRIRLLGAEHPQVAASLNNLGLVLGTQGKYEEAEAEHRKALALREKVLEPGHPDIAQSLNNLAISLKYQDELEQAEALYRRVITLWQESLGPEHPGLAQAYNNLGLALDDQGRFAEAEVELRRAVELHQGAMRAEHPLTAQSQSNLAMVLTKQGRYQEAETQQQRALAVQRKVLGDEHPDVATSYNRLGAILVEVGKYAEAEAAYRTSIALRQQQLGAEHQTTAVVYTNLAEVLRLLGRHEDAEVEARRALAILEPALGPEHFNVGLTRTNLALILADQGQPEQAEAELRRVLEVQEATLPPEHPQLATSRETLAGFLWAQGKRAEAQAEYQRALALRQEALEPDHPDRARSHAELGRVLLERGRPREALPHLEQAWEILQRPQTPPRYQAPVAFQLARALWATGRPSRARAHLLAERARDMLHEAGEIHPVLLAEIRAWLDLHAIPG